MRPVPAMDVYGIEPRFLPHTLRFLARPRSTPRPASKTLKIRNLGGGELGQATYQVEYLDLEGWLRIDRRGEGSEQMLEISASADQKKAREGVYRALVHVACPGAHNSPQAFEVWMWTPRDEPVSSVVVDNEDPACELSPYYWLTPRIRTSVWRKGENKSYAVVAGRSRNPRNGDVPTGPHSGAISRIVRRERSDSPHAADAGEGHVGRDGPSSSRARYDPRRSHGVNRDRCFRI